MGLGGLFLWRWGGRYGLLLDLDILSLFWLWLFLLGDYRFS